MPVTRARWVLAAAVVLIVLVGLSGLDAAMAQGNPFGVGRAAPVPVTGVAGWIIAKQALFYRELSGLIRAARADGAAVWGLLGISFLYGIFHAAGPGHGKAVISSYLIANDETWRRGVLLSFAAALLQALTAVAIVGVAAVLLNATAATMSRAVNWIELASYALIVLIGLRLTWVKGRSFLAAWRRCLGPAPALATAAPVHDHDHPAHDHGHHSHAACGHHDHDHASAWGHAHGPEPAELAGPGGWRRGLSAIVAVGLRPCSGAILVLVFALAQGLLWAGVAATLLMGLGTALTVAVIATLAVSARALAGRLAAGGAGYGTLALRGLEVLASILVALFGVALLTGIMVSERMAAF